MFRDRQIFIWWALSSKITAVLEMCGRLVSLWLFSLGLHYLKALHCLACRKGVNTFVHHVNCGFFSLRIKNLGGGLINQLLTILKVLATIILSQSFWLFLLWIRRPEVVSVFLILYSFLIIKLFHVEYVTFSIILMLLRCILHTFYDFIFFKDRTCSSHCLICFTKHRLFEFITVSKWYTCLLHEVVNLF